MPDYLALVGDTSDGYPGLNGWGAKSAAAVLARYAHLEHIPASAEEWSVTVRGAEKLAATLVQDLELALLFRRLATIDLQAPVSTDVDTLEWWGAGPRFPAFCETIKKPRLVERVRRFMAKQPTRQWTTTPRT
jgi:5'-3' exonuclease